MKTVCLELGGGALRRIVDGLLMVAMVAGMCLRLPAFRGALASFLVSHVMPAGLVTGSALNIAALEIGHRPGHDRRRDGVTSLVCSIALVRDRPRCRRSAAICPRATWRRPAWPLPWCQSCWPSPC